MECPKANEEHFQSDQGCPRPAERHPGFPMPGERKPNFNEGHTKTNKGQCWPEEEHTRSDKEYFVFPNPGVWNSGQDEEFLRTNKTQTRPEEERNMPNKRCPRFARSREGHTDQDEGKVKTNKGQPRTEELPFRLDKEHHGFQKPEQGPLNHKKTNPACNEFPKKSKKVSEYNLKVGKRKPHAGRLEQQAEENKQQTVKSENPSGKNELKKKKLKHKNENRESNFSFEPEKRMELNGMRKRFSASTKLTPKSLLTIRKAKGPSLKRKETQTCVRNICAKRRIKLCSRRTRSQVGQNRMPVGHSKADTVRNDPSVGGKKASPIRKKMPVDGLCAPQNQKKQPLPPLQEAVNPLLNKKKLLRSRVHPLPSETLGEKQQPIEIIQLLGVSSQRGGRTLKLSRPNTRLPSIQGQQLTRNELPNVTR